jgi:hypothetical protein
MLDFVKLNFHYLAFIFELFCHISKILTPCEHILASLFNILSSLSLVFSALTIIIHSLTHSTQQHFSFLSHRADTISSASSYFHKTKRSIKEIYVFPVRENQPLFFYYYHFTIAHHKLNPLCFFHSRLNYSRILCVSFLCSIVRSHVNVKRFNLQNKKKELCVSFFLLWNWSGVECRRRRRKYGKNMLM